MATHAGSGITRRRARNPSARSAGPNIKTSWKAPIRADIFRCHSVHSPEMIQ